jgi:antitoxin component of MazEF toxin-antitoxin module
MTSTLEIPLIRIGNSRGIRLPAPWIKKFALEDGILLEDRGDAVLLKPRRRKSPPTLSWSETAREMAASDENWTPWNLASNDGLKEIPWD